MKISVLILFVLTVFCASAQQFSAVPFVHSHNDYLQEKPLVGALEAGAKSIEIDLFLQDGKLMVAHTKAEIKKGNTFEDQYILPLKKYLSEKDVEHEFHFMIDIKSESVSTLKKIQKTLEKYPELFSKDGVQVVISGNRPKPSTYSEYANFIWFDGRKPIDVDVPGGNRIALISQNLSKFTRWRGEGKIPLKEEQNIVLFLKECHTRNVPVRFWNSGDSEKMYEFLVKAGVDYINSDKPTIVQKYLQSYLIGQSLPTWFEGCFDIHHINTGRGNVSMLTFPDGTTMLVDMGDMSEKHPRTLSKRNTPALPNNSKSPAQWVADYVYQHNPKDCNTYFDYALITHFHDDHFGELDKTKKQHSKGNYALTGIMELGSIIPIKKLVDRGANFPIKLDDPKVQKKFGLRDDKYSMIQTLEEYWEFINYQRRQGLKYEDFEVGSISQFKLLENDAFNFTFRNVFVNGIITNEDGKIVFEKFKAGEYPGENNLSAGFKISYGDFDYYAGGDISGINNLGETDINSMETKVAPHIGAVDAAVLNHHGNRDSQNKIFVSALQPRVWLQPSWSADHPDDNVLRRIMSQELYPGERNVFSTSILEATKLVIGGNIEEAYKATQGHIVLRVYPGGKNYTVFVLNDKNTEREITSYYNYQSR